MSVTEDFLEIECGTGCAPLFGADDSLATETERGALVSAVAGGVDHAHANELDRAFSRYRDPVTEMLGILSAEWESAHKARMATLHRLTKLRPSPLRDFLQALAGVPKDEKKKGDRPGLFETAEKKIGRQLSAMIRTHPLWPWLEPRKGLRGVHVARIIAMLGDPLRFPGRPCSGGHILPEDWIGTCGRMVKVGDEWSHCGLPVGSLRRGSGTRPLWHFFGVHVEDGRMPRRKKGSKCTWRPSARGALLQPDGPADQIVKYRVDPWRTIFDEAKARITAERGIAVLGVETEASTGLSLRPFEIHRLSRLIAAKAFLADLLAAWRSAV